MTKANKSMEQSWSETESRATFRRRRPAIWHSRYLLLRSLATELERQASLRLRRPDGIDIVDVGCGTRPYEPLLRPYARSYIGVDVYPAPTVDVVAHGESLPFEDASFDCVLCTQVLEHAEDPQAVCSELHRVLRPTGVALISTHGVARYHGDPNLDREDYWRWTHRGLERLLQNAASWHEIEICPNGGTGTTIAYLVGRECEIVSTKLRVALVSAPFVTLLNLIAWSLDAIQLRVRPDSRMGLASNYLAIAVR